MSFEIERVTDDAGAVVNGALLDDCERVHLQLRPHLAGKYAATIGRVFAGGARMVAALDGQTVVGVAVYRVYENSYAGKQLFVDDLVTDETHRSHGAGRALLQYLEQIGKQQAVDQITLDSGTQRTRAHKFYLREGFEIKSFHFVKLLK